MFLMFHFRFGITEGDKTETWMSSILISLCEVLKFPIAFSKYTYWHKNFFFGGDLRII